MTSKTNVLVIALDSADPNLLLRWCDSGDLPNIAKLRASGAWGHLQTFPGLADDAIWASFSTGNHPGKHGRFHNVQIDPETDQRVHLKDNFLKTEPFWKKLSDAGKKVAVIDVPKCPLVKGLNGVQVSDWRVHGRDGQTRSHPPELAAEILEKFGKDENDIYEDDSFLCKLTSLNETDQNVLFEMLTRSIEKKTDYLESLITADSWDLFLGVFKECHCAGHQFWNEPEGKSEHPTKEKRNYLKEIYIAIDFAIGRMLKHANHDTKVLVLSDLGMAENHTGDHLLDNILLHLEANPLHRIFQNLNPRNIKPRKLSRLAKRMLVRLDKMRIARQVPHNEISGAIKISQKCKTSIQWYNRVSERIEKELRNIVDPSTGQILVTDVVNASKTYQGDAADHLPDLLVIWNRKIKIDRAKLSNTKIVGSDAPSYRPGNHVPGGIVFSNIHYSDTKGFQKQPSIIDIAPTICSMLEINLSESDGFPIAELVAGQIK